jgi:hypothetical protein
MRRRRRLSIAVEHREVTVYAATDHQGPDTSNHSMAILPLAAVEAVLGVAAGGFCEAIRQEWIHVHLSAEGKLYLCSFGGCVVQDQTCSPPV